MAKPRQLMDNSDLSSPASNFAVAYMPATPISEVTPRHTEEEGSEGRGDDVQFPTGKLLIHPDLTELPQNPPHSRFKQLLNEFRTRPTRNLNDMEEWNNHLRKKLDNKDSDVRLYYKYASRMLRPPRLDTRLSTLAGAISSANWKKSGNSPAQHLNSVLISTKYCSTEEVQGLWWNYDHFRMGLKVGGRPLVPSSTAEETAEYYGVDFVSLGLVFAIRYTRLESSEGNSAMEGKNIGDKRDIQVAPLGKHFSLILLHLLKYARTRSSLL